jgi:hypothetical protein
MSLLPEDGTTEARLRELLTRIGKLERGDRLNAAALGSGGLTVRGGKIVILDTDGHPTFEASTAGLTLDGLLEVFGRIDARGGGAFRYYDPAGTRIVYIGELVIDGSSIGYGMFVDRPNGMRLMTVSSDGIDLWGFDGDRRLAIDSNGLAQPYLPVSFAVINSSVSSTSWTTVAEATVWRSHNKVNVDVRWTRTGTPSGQVRLREVFSDTTIDTSGTLTSAAYIALQGTLPGSGYIHRFLRVEARLTAGSGDIHPLPIGGYIGRTF